MQGLDFWKKNSENKEFILLFSENYLLIYLLIDTSY